MYRYINKMTVNVLKKSGVSHDEALTLVLYNLYYFVKYDIRDKKDIDNVWFYTHFGFGKHTKDSIYMPCGPYLANWRSARANFNIKHYGYSSARINRYKSTTSIRQILNKQSLSYRRMVLIIDAYKNYVYYHECRTLDIRRWPPFYKRIFIILQHIRKNMLMTTTKDRYYCQNFIIKDYDLLKKIKD